MSTTSSRRTFSRAIAREFPTFANLICAVRRDPSAYRARKGLGFLAVRSDASVVEVFVGRRGGITKRIVGKVA